MINAPRGSKRLAPESARMERIESQNIRQRSNVQASSSRDQSFAETETETKQNLFSMAATKIGRWWRRTRSSLAVINFNINGNHSEEFRMFLNKHRNIPKHLTHFQDAALFEDIKSGNWNSTRFQRDNVHFCAMNLFASGQITWEQKATISDIIETSHVYGPYVPYPILLSDGDFSPEAKDYLLPLLKKSNYPMGYTEFSQEELTQFRIFVGELPFSERFFFIFQEQKFDTEGSFPSAHSDLRYTMIGSVHRSGIPVIRATHRLIG